MTTLAGYSNPPFGFQAQKPDPLKGGRKREHNDDDTGEEATALHETTAVG